jgi:hypothetical protein
MYHFSIRGKNMFQDIFGSVGVKATNKYLNATIDRVNEKLKIE